MPLIGEDRSFLLKLINVTGSTMYPMALALLLPVFLYAMVLEKEVIVISFISQGTIDCDDENEWHEDARLLDSSIPFQPTHDILNLLPLPTLRLLRR
jgi:hypothetical protein